MIPKITVCLHNWYEFDREPISLTLAVILGLREAADVGAGTAALIQAPQYFNVLRFEGFRTIWFQTRRVIDFPLKMVLQKGIRFVILKGWRIMRIDLPG